jgi:hypothetical protein
MINDPWFLDRWISFYYVLLKESMISFDKIYESKNYIFRKGF